MSVASLNSLQGNVVLQSTAGTISINNTGAGNINLEASHAGSQGGVLNLGVLPAPGGQQPLTGQLLLQSSGGSVVFTYPDGGYAQGGHKINVEAVAGGVVGVNTINNVASDATHNFTLTAGANVSIVAGTNAVTISSTDTVGVASLGQNAGTAFTGAVQLVNGANITMSDNGAGAITIASTDTVGVATISNVAGGTLISGAVNIVPKNSGIATSVLGQDLQIENIGVLGIIPNANGLPQPLPLVGNIGLVAGTNVSLVESGQNITINASGDGAGIETINTISPSAGEFGITGGSGITIATPVANAIEIVNAGVLSVVTGANPPAVGAISLVAGTNVSITEAVAGAFTINASGDGAGIETINTISPLSGNFVFGQGSGMLFTPQANGIEIANAGLLSVQLTGVGTPITGAITLTTGSGITGSEPVPGTIDIVNSGVLSVATGASTPATGAISLVAGTNVTITEASGAFTINSSGGGGGGVTGFEVNNDVLSTGVLHLNEATGITMTRGVMNDGVYFFNSGVLSVATGASTPATGAISLVAGTNVTITEASGAFTINSSGGGGGSGIQTISGIAPNGAGDWTLDNGTGIGYVALATGIQLTNTGVLSVKANSGGAPFTGAITIESGSGISVSEGVGGIITVTNTAQGGGGAYTYTSNVGYPLTDPAGYFTLPTPPAVETYNICDLTSYNFFPANWDLATTTITLDGSATNVDVGDTLLCSNTTHFFSCPATWGAGNLLINKYVYSPASQDTIALPNDVGVNAYSTIYAISANDSVISILALQSGTGNVMLISHDFTTLITKTLSVLAYDFFQQFDFTLNNFTASDANNFQAVTIGANASYYPQGGAASIDFALLVGITTSDTPMTVFFQQDAYFTPVLGNPFLTCCIQLVTTDVNRLVITYDNYPTFLPPEQPVIEEWIIAPPSLASSTAGGPPTSYYIMRNLVNADGLIAQTVGGDVNQIFKTLPLNATNTIITGLTPATNYSLYGPTIYQPPTPTNDINLSSSLIDDQYLYQQSASLALTVTNAIPLGTGIILSFEVPCSTSVVTPLVFFPVNAYAIISGALTTLPSSGTITSVIPSGTATITIEIYTPIHISIGDDVQLTLPQFTILPPPPP